MTYAQFQAFIDDPEGFYNSRWWDGLSIHDGHNKAPGDQGFKFWNHPRERVSWYDAVAFCRWLSWRLGEEALILNPSPSGRRTSDSPRPEGEGPGVRAEIRLPTEFEWEKAARANTGWVYPYGDEFDVAKGNTGENGIDQTSAVGIFPDGDTPHWDKPIADLSGNVWEWCLTDYENPQTDPEKENVRSGARRVLRGGSWSNGRYGARAVFRGLSDPSDRSYGSGFRVVCLPYLLNRWTLEG